ncbi:isochorismate synthase [Rhodococcus sp. AD45-ID]|uniref:isochorismate synthase n=1 Tax=unclassified Rhodococcus (in: high G+C Gram-positive bacteria) TaxID=192944 RepID=UPI0005D3E142|nr:MULTISPECIES: isochorismate synthase [unclassified Rhodococcus (in: high G+C Gram-positive bacteria)]KJF23789.1 Isochorismate synthase dhbC [Rhodococcus sp. AD45]PSR42172.1 isochorismate synthase [Rhodococcus sp. AD45-ID]
MDGFVLSRPDHSVLTRGVRRSFDDAGAATHALSEGSATLIVGALPFDPSGATALYEPAEVTVTGSAWRSDTSVDLPHTHAVREIPSPADHLRRVEKLVTRLRDGDLGKVVSARTVELRAESPISPTALAARMATLNPAANTFAVDLSAAGTDFVGHSLVGATPEVLVSRRGNVVTCRPLAGSARRTAETEADRVAGDSLLSSTKNLAEHAFVTDWIRDVLGPLCSELSIPSTPELTSTHEVWHLASPIRGILRDPTTALALAIALHPTPALCGTPTTAALNVIRDTEEPRRFYGGAVGWCNNVGDGDWVVAIRCAEISADGRTAWASAGGGIVADSDPQDELDETTTKLRTLLTALGVSDTN